MAQRGAEMTDEVSVKYYALVDMKAGEEVPWGLISQVGAIVRRWIPSTGTWVDAPRHWDYLIGREPGAREITEAAAEGLKTDKRLAQMTDAAAVERMSH